MSPQKTISLFILLFLPFLGMSAEVWNQKSNLGGAGRHRGTGIAIGNRGYFGLGHHNGAGPNILFNDWWEFDPGTNTWSQKASYPFPTYAAASFTIGMKGYVGAGVSAGTQFHSFDPIANTWTAIQPLPVASTDRIGFAVNGKGYYLYSNQLYEYDPDLNTWTLKNPAPFFPSSWCSSFTIGDKVYVKTGGSLYEYKASTDEWVSRAPFPGLASGGSSAFAVRGKGYVICGYIGWLSELSSEVWEFDPALNTWTLMEEFPGTGRRFSIGFSIGNKGYFGSGTNGTNMRDFWEFDELLSTDENETPLISVYPNPATDFVVITCLNNAEVRLFDITGKIILSTQVNDTETFDISALENGTYLVECLTNDKRVIQKLIIQN